MHTVDEKQVLRWRSGKLPTQSSMVFALIQCSNLKMAGRGRQSIDYMKPKEPSFLAKFKREIGYKEGPTVESKVISIVVSMYIILQRWTSLTK